MVWNSTGNQRFGVVTKIPFLDTRQSSDRNVACFSAEPTCSSTALEWAQSNSPSWNGRSRPSAWTNLIPG